MINRKFHELMAVVADLCVELDKTIVIGADHDEDTWTMGEVRPTEEGVRIEILRCYTERNPKAVGDEELEIDGLDESIIFGGTVWIINDSGRDDYGLAPYSDLHKTFFVNRCIYMDGNYIHLPLKKLAAKLKKAIDAWKQTLPSHMLER